MSRVMNGTANVDSDKRQRVEQAIKEIIFRYAAGKAFQEENIFDVTLIERETTVRK